MAKVTRIKASGSKKPEKATKQNAFVRTLKAIGGYFAGAWYELRQVRWPTRRSTWELTLAVILFSAFFAVIILLLDSLFKYLFELLIA